MARIYADPSLICSVYGFALIRYRNSDSKYDRKVACKTFEGVFL